jgi:hypothetical protein
MRGEVKYRRNCVKLAILASFAIAAHRASTVHAQLARHLLLDLAGDEIGDLSAIGKLFWVACASNDVQGRIDFC